MPATQPAQVLAGVFSHSQSLIADGVHSLSDLISELTFFSVSFLPPRVYYIIDIFIKDLLCYFVKLNPYSRV